MSKKLPAPRRINRKSKEKPFPIVAIGASAGGLEAMMQLLKQLPSNTGMAYVYIQHLGPSQESMLSVILGKVTSMKVCEAKNLLAVKPDCLYILPPSKEMTLSDGILKLSQRKARPFRHMPIDNFFISLAEKHREGAIGIVLSGNANDGTLGLKAIKKSGGLTIAQDESAKFQSMPRSAIAEGAVDLVLSPGETARELVRLSKRADIFHHAVPEETEEAAASDEEMGSILTLLKKSTGVDFGHYKRKTIKRRIIRRMLLYKLDDLKDYNQYLRQHTQETGLLYQDLLINVTSFFRDAPTLEFIKKKVLPRILKSKSPGDPVRIWVPACSTGEEAYSIAILLMEVLGEKAGSTAIQVFATDLSDPAIGKARLGLYSTNDLMDISPRRLARFFSKVDNGYRIIKTIRDLCVFAPHNVFKDPPFSHIDLISCCNLLIYLDNILQKKLIATFHYSLNNNGHLVLGKSETTGTSPQLFTQVDKRYKVYARKKEAATKAMFDMTYRLPEAEKPDAAGLRKPRTRADEKILDLEKEVDGIMLAKYVPASVVVNHDLEVLQFRGSTSLFLEHLPGKASLNLLKMVRTELAFELRNTIHKASKSGQTAKKAGLEIKHKGITHQVTLEVVPLKPEETEKLFLVIFEETALPRPDDVKASFSKDKLVKKLQDELQTVREDMRSIVEEQEASNEELQSANEEIVSSNEELQSINEELETSKEEVESANEELMTINQELQIRNDQLAEAYEYAEAVFFTIREAILVLDKDLRIKLANRSFYQIFKMQEDEVEGILIYDLGNRKWDMPQLHALLEEIIPQSNQFQGYEITNHFPLIGEKVLMINGRKIIQKIHRQQLVLLAIEDITEHRKGQRIIAEREALFRNMANNAPVLIWVTDPDDRRTFFNRTWLEYTGNTLEEETAATWAKNIHPADLESFLKAYQAGFSQKKPFRLECRLKRFDGQYRWILSIGKPGFSREGSFTGFTGSCTEIHDQRLMNEELEKRVKQRTSDLQETNKELERSNDELQQFAYVASHDLQEPLRKIITFSDRLQQKFDATLATAGKDYILKITDSAGRMARLIDDLLNFSKISRAGNAFTKTDLGAVTKKVLKDFDVIAGEKKARITSKDLPVIDAVPLQMEQLFHNLISNALKFTGNKPPVISIRSRELTPRQAEQYPGLDASRVHTEITVTDNGIGFNQEFAEQIFIIFQRLNDKQSFSGTGIGLALCRKIVNHHGGHIYATSKETLGTTFHIILPLKQ